MPKERRARINWIPILGDFTTEGRNVVFHGGEVAVPQRGPGTAAPQWAVGDLISNQRLGSGTISATVEFLGDPSQSACDLILAYAPDTRGFLSAGLGGGSLASVRYFANQWNTISSVGLSQQLEMNRRYDLHVAARGSQVQVSIDGVDVLSATLPFPVPSAQTGIFCNGPSDISITGFDVEGQPPAAFIVMQFTPPYNELYEEVIRPVCEEMGLRAIRADDFIGPGIIIADIVRQISEANVVIAEITPENPNVYYEVGYAHAINKPTVLIKQKETDLPFDVSPFRVLFYEDSIAGKRAVEEGLRKHLQAIQASGAIAK